MMKAVERESFSTVGGSSRLSVTSGRQRDCRYVSWEVLRRCGCTCAASGTLTNTCAFEVFARQLWFVIVYALFSE